MTVNLKSPALGPILHAGAAALVAVAWPTAEYLQAYLVQHAADPQWDFKAMFVGLAIALLGWFLSQYRNAGAIAVPNGTGVMIKAVEAAGGQAVLTDAASVVSTKEPVLILRNAPDTSPPAVTPPPTGDRPYDPDDPLRKFRDAQR